jgi:hypothetical protein
VGTVKLPFELKVAAVKLNVEVLFVLTASLHDASAVPLAKLVIVTVVTPPAAIADVLNVPVPPENTIEAVLDEVFAPLRE